MTDKIQKSGDTPLVRGHGLAPTEADEKRALSYINRVEWRFAKTMADTPHCYTVVTWNPHLETEFWFLAMMIAAGPIRQLWAPGRYANYIHLGPHKYWTMRLPPDCILINRTGR